MMNIAIATPEIFLFGATCLILLTELFLREDGRMITYLLVQVALIATALLVYSTSNNMAITGLNDMYVRDGLASILKISLLLLTSFVFVYVRKYLADHNLWRSEFFLLCLLSVLGMMIISSANNLLVMYLGLELMALSMYALVAFNRDSGQSSEAAMKYFVLGAVASGLLLYGISLLYGLSGKLDIAGIATWVATQSVMTNLPLLFALVFIVAGIAFKFGAVPFHMWVPDVYQGAPLAVTVFLGSVSKIAAVAILLRVLAETLGSASQAWSQMLVVFASLSLIIGNLSAIAQTDIKRMFAYSTVAQMGFVLFGALTGNAAGFSAALFYTITYAFTAAAGFGVLILLSKHEKTHVHCNDAGHGLLLTDLKGLHQRNPWYAFIMLLVLLSMAGIPPLVGFYAKFAVIQAVMQTSYWWSAILMVVLSVVAAFYYLRVIKYMYFDDVDVTSNVAMESIDFTATLSANSLLILLLGLFPNALMTLCSGAVLASRL